MNQELWPKVGALSPGAGACAGSRISSLVITRPRYCAEEGRGEGPREGEEGEVSIPQEPPDPYPGPPPLPEPEPGESEPDEDDLPPDPITS